MRADEVRGEVGARLGRQVPDVVWEHYVSLGLVSEVTDGYRDVGWLTDDIMSLLQGLHDLERAPRMAPKRRPPSITRSIWAVSLAVAQLANDDMAVGMFRQEILDGELLDQADVEEWINRHAGAGAATTYITAPLPPDTKLVRTKDARRAITPPLRSVTHMEINTRFLSYATDGDEWVRIVPTTIDSPLDRLRRLAANLAPAYGWDEPQSVIFVLTASTPIIDPLRVTNRPAPIRDGKVHTWAARVIIEVHPAVTPAELEHAYRRARDQLNLGKVRTLSDKHAELSAFCTQRQDESWSQRLKEWNRRHPDWRYDQESNFRRDAGRAHRRLLSPGGYPGATPIRAVPTSTDPPSEVTIVFDDLDSRETSETVRNALAAWEKRQEAEPGL